MKIFSWNINGIRAIERKGFKDWVEKDHFDILLLQEIKISQKDILSQGLTFPGFEIFWNPAERPGYSGTAILVKKELLKKYPQLKIENFPQDNEGRVQFLNLDKLFLVNTYFPNAGPELKRLDYKLEFNQALAKKLNQIKKEKIVLIGGDFNVAHQEIDLARPKANEGKAGFTKQERVWLTKFLDSGYVDTFRYLYPEKIKYSWWSYRAQARERNVGWRIDYFCLDKKYKHKLKNAFIWDQVLGSDHCPVGVDFKLYD